MSRAAIVIPVYNGERYLPALLASIRAQSLTASGTDPVELTTFILVDNASTDAGIAVAMAEHSGLTVLRLPENQGFGAACNVGISHALEQNVDWVFVLNQDLKVQAGALANCIRTAQDHPQSGLIAFYQLNDTGESIDPIFRAYLPAEYWDDLLLREARSGYSVPFVPAAAILLRAACLRELGGFDPLYFMYLEDRDLCDRLVKHGWQVIISTIARVQHDCGQVRANKRSFAWNMNWYRSRMIYHLKTSPRPISLSLLSGLKYLSPKWSIHESLHWALAWFQCLPLLPQIARHRKRVSIPVRPLDN